ncbi:YeiH family protein [Rugosibacter aromaticivorans]|nr:YeiH family protein [Rugosibacter aromaticivorans]
MAAIGQYFPGLALSGSLAALSIELGKLNWLQANGISVLTLAILLGMVVGNTVFPRIAMASAAGVTFSQQNLLRLGIVLYGFRLTFQDIAYVGISGVVIDAMVLSSTFAMAWLLGTKVFKLDQKTILLIGVGSSICGAAAVMATQSVVRARTEQATVAVSTVIVFGTLALFLYPAMYYINEQWQLLSLSPIVSGIYIGATVHEVAQVAAAASSISAEITNTAVITKMIRVMMLGPFLLILSVYLSRRQSRETINMTSRYDTHKTNGRITIPWFALGFSVVIALNSLAILPGAIVSGITEIDTFLLAMAMVALGLSSHISTIRRAGVMPFLFAASLFVWLIFGGLAVTIGVTTWLG